jgi:hypothetical protein
MARRAVKAKRWRGSAGGFDLEQVAVMSTDRLILCEPLQPIMPGVPVLCRVWYRSPRSNGLLSDDRAWEVLFDIAVTKEMLDD